MMMGVAVKTVDAAFDKRPRPVDDSSANRPLDLADEHGQLLRQVAVRTEELMAAVAAGRPPDRELRRLLGYLRTEILRQAADEEMLLFPAGGGHPAVTRLARDHALLRVRIEALARAARDGKGAAARLASGFRDLLRQLERHLAAEEAVLADSSGICGVPATTALGARPHEWYPLTEGRVIDLDALPPDKAADAITERLLRLRRGEDVELWSRRDPFPVWRRIDELVPGRYGFVYLEEGPGRWRVLAIRREPA
jgi:uncharacterized protein (DUF2249 family)